MVNDGILSYFQSTKLQISNSITMNRKEQKFNKYTTGLQRKINLKEAIHKQNLSEEWIKNGKISQPPFNLLLLATLQSPSLSIFSLQIIARHLL